METTRMKVCAYCRVSTKDKEQLTSFENQKQFFLREFGEDPRYELVQVYADCGTSGTRLSRPAFDQMVKDAGIDKTALSGDFYRIVAPPRFSRILVRNTSRFARNVSSDLLIKTLLRNGVDVRFCDLDVCTSDENGIFTTHLFQTMDEQESRSKSMRVIFGMQEGVKKGVLLESSRIYGYKYYPKPVNRLEAIPEEADVVRLIFRLYNEGSYGAQRICRELTARGIYTRKGVPFHMNTVLKMLRNETYTGCGVRNKYSTGSVFRKTGVRRTEHPYVFETDRVDPIISHEAFEQAQTLMNARAQTHRRNARAEV